MTSNVSEGEWNKVEERRPSEQMLTPTNSRDDEPDSKDAEVGEFHARDVEASRS